MIIDVHNHYLPEEAFTALGQSTGGGTKRFNDGKIEFTFYHKLAEIDTHLRDMDEAGIDMAVLGMGQWNIRGLEMCRLLNEGFARVIKEHPDRFLGCAHAAVDAGQAGIDEMKRGVEELGLHGVVLMSSFLDITYSDERMVPFFEAIQKLNVPVVVHPSLKPKGIEDDCSIARSMGRGFDISKAGLRIMYDVFPRFPDIKFIMPHFGGVIPFMKSRIMAFYEPRPELGIQIPEDIKPLPKTPNELQEFGMVEPFEEIFGKLYFDTAGHGGNMKTMKASLNHLRTDRLMFGCDYPMEIHTGRDLKAYVDGIKGLDIPKEEIDMILGGNAARLFGLQ